VSQVVYGGENRLKGLPVRFGQLTQLQELDVSGCELETLPQSLSRCVSLVRLWLSNNRLQTLPVHIGDLQQLKELHVRNNRLRYLPASVDLLHLYTFTAQNNRFVDEVTASEMCYTPAEGVAPLMELAARAALDSNLKWDTPSLPTSLREMLSSPGRCSVCEGPFFNYNSSVVTFKTVGVFYRLPLCLSLCTPRIEHSGQP
jgi:Leucine-rich repeat (LRR) protein